MFAEKTDSESSCLLFEKEKRLPERMHYVCRKYALRPIGRGLKMHTGQKGAAPPRGSEKPYQTKESRKKYIFSLTNTFQKGFPYQNTESLLRLFQLIFHAAFSAPDSPVSEISHITGSPFTQCQYTPPIRGLFSL